MELTIADKEIIKNGKRDKFWYLLLEYIDELEEDTKTGIISPMNEDMSKSKRNDRDLMLLRLQFLEEVKNLPDRVLTLIENIDQ